jgi:hypothetical protein
MNWVTDDTKRAENCKSYEASGGICGYNISDSTAAAPFVCYCKDGPRRDKCVGHGMLYLYFLQNFLELLVLLRCYEFTL